MMDLTLHHLNFFAITYGGAMRQDHMLAINANFFSFWLRARERLLISVQRSPTCPLDHSSHTQLIHYGEKSLLEVELPIPGFFFRWMSCHWPGEIAPLTKTLLNHIFLCNFSNINSINQQLIENLATKAGTAVSIGTGYRTLWNLSLS